MSKSELVKNAFAACGENVHLDYENEDIVNVLYSLCYGGDTTEIPLTSNNLNLIGLYFRFVRGDIPNAIRYYEMAISRGSSTAAHNLSCLYKKQGDTENMLRYYQIGSDMGYADATYNIAIYYEKLNDIPNAIKYYQIAAHQGHPDAANNLGCIYKRRGDLENMFKYFDIAISLGHTSAMYNLAIHYKQSGDFKNTKKYLMMAFRNGMKLVLKSILELVSSVYWDYDMNETILLAFEYGFTKEEIYSSLPESYQKNKQKSFDYLGICEICFQQKKQIETLTSRVKEKDMEITELQYCPGGPGYLEAKKHFESLTKN